MTQSLTDHDAAVEIAGERVILLAERAAYYHTLAVIPSEREESRSSW